MRSLVSVIIPAYNAKNYIRETVESALGQTYRNYEIIVVDDGSTDGTGEILKDYQDRIIYLRKDNGGPASARNMGIKKSRGELIAFLDADDVWLPDKLEKQVKFLEENPQIHLLFTAVIGYEDGRVYPVEENRLRGSIFHQLLKGNFITTSTVMVRRECLEEELFDEDRNLISVEDYNLWLRLSRKYVFGYLDEPTIKYRFRGGLTDNFEAMFKADFYNFRKLRETFPEWRLEINPFYWIGLSSYHFKAGKEFFYFQKYFQARKEFLLSFLTCPIQLKPLLWLTISLLPSKLINRLRGKKSR